MTENASECPRSSFDPFDVLTSDCWFASTMSRPAVSMRQWGSREAMRCFIKSGLIVRELNPRIGP